MSAAEPHLPERVRVLIADDHRLFAEALEAILAGERRIDVVGRARNGAEALELALELEPDVVLMDIALGQGSGIEATRTITQVYPNVRVVVLTGTDDRDDVLRVVRAGAHGYLTKDQSPEGLARALRGLAHGEAPISRRLASYLMDEVRRGDRRRQLAAMVPDREHLARGVEDVDLGAVTRNETFDNERRRRRLGHAASPLRPR